MNSPYTSRANYHIFIPIVTLLIVFTTTTLFAQDLNRFQSEVDQIVAKFDTISFQTEKKLAVFTGSSSVRLWSTLSVDMPELNTMNTGFGGSTYNELAHYQFELITKYQPDIVVVYEGDNDVTGAESAVEITEIAKAFYTNLMNELPNANIFVLAAKPSPLRWHLKSKYDELNSLMDDYTKQHEQLEYIDIWSPMIGPNQRPLPHIFISDSLHMNAHGYEIWTQTIVPILAPYFD